MSDDGLNIGHAAAERAAHHADRVEPLWKDGAYSAFVDYAERYDTFTTEQVRRAATDVLPPPDKRAWGQIALRAKRNKVIGFYSYRSAGDRRGHGRTVTVWRSLLR